MKLRAGLFVVSGVCLLLFLLPCAAQAQALAQDPPSKLSAGETQLLLEFIRTELEVKLYAVAPESNKDKASASQRLAEIYSKIATSPGASHALMSHILGNYSSSREAARSAVQVSQAADEASIRMQLLLIGQNERIINLLEQIARKR